MNGVTNVDGGYSIQESPINIIGKGFAYPVRNGPLQGSFQISKYFVGKEEVLKHVDETPISGSINYGDNSFGFESGYLSEYSFSAGIGQIPQSEISISVFGDIGKGIDHPTDGPTPEIQIPNQGSIELNVDGYQNNRVTNFSYNIRIDRNPIYAIGSEFPVEVQTTFPITQQASFNIDVNDYEIDSIKSYLIKPKQIEDLRIILKNPINESVIDFFNIKNARLVSQSINSNSTDLLTVSLTYNGYINRKDREFTKIAWIINGLSEGDNVVIPNNGDLTRIVDKNLTFNYFVLPLESTYSDIIQGDDYQARTDIAFIDENSLGIDAVVIEHDGDFAVLGFYEMPTRDIVPWLSLDPEHSFLDADHSLKSIIKKINQHGEHIITLHAQGESTTITVIDFLGDVPGEVDKSRYSVRILGNVSSEDHIFYGSDENSVFYCPEQKVLLTNGELDNITELGGGQFASTIAFHVEIQDSKLPPAQGDTISLIKL